MAQRRLFVSHSSRTPEDLHRLKDLCTLLKQAGYYILVDKNADHGNQEAEIYPGDDWELRINEWLAECDAAVILFNTTAIKKSDWVKKEATILSWRREVQENFTLIPVLFSGVDPNQLKQGLYGVLRITKDQCITGIEEVGALATRLQVGLGPPGSHDDTPFGRLEEIVRKILQQHADSDTLKQAWNALESDNKPEWNPDETERFAGALTRFLLRDRISVLESLQRLVDRIRPRIKHERAQELVKCLACLWVEQSAAGGLSGASHDSHIVALNGNFLPTFTAERYIERAWPLSDRRHFVPVDQQMARTPAGIQEAVRKYFRPPDMPDNPAMNAKLDRRIAARSEPIVVLLMLGCDNPAQPQWPDPKLLSDARVPFPNLIFLLGAGDSPPVWSPKPIRLLTPPLDTDLEFDMRDALWDTHQFLNRLYGVAK
jgi:hypothetical protein